MDYRMTKTSLYLKRIQTSSGVFPILSDQISSFFFSLSLHIWSSYNCFLHVPWGFLYWLVVSYSSFLVSVYSSLTISSIWCHKGVNSYHLFKVNALVTTDRGYHCANELDLYCVLPRIIWIKSVSKGLYPLYHYHNIATFKIIYVTSHKK